MPLIRSSTYKSPFFLFNKHLQTIIPALFRRVKDVAYSRERIETIDHDFLDLDWVLNPSNKLAIISHGLEGDSNRPYVRGLAKALKEVGYEVLAWNFRGCSGEVNKQLRFYHSGATDDLEQVIDHALKKKNYREIILAGFSLGGNLTLKFLGEKGGNIPPQIKKSIVFSVPLNLHSSCLQISKPGNFIYSKRFLNRLKKKIEEKSLILPDKLSIAGYQKIKNLKDFDDVYTAPLHGFKDAVEYYEACSAINFLERISIPTLIVNAKNDPFLSTDCFPHDLLEHHPFVHFESPKQGGHCGFYSKNINGLYWSEIRALQFIFQGT
ncbi:MAG: alpha/beta fold hydrolase [Bacteroidota bacterium]|nr:alpha/beta fold hydrolase [Bacteroidota bacterium]